MKSDSIPRRWRRVDCARGAEGRRNRFGRGPWKSLGPARSARWGWCEEEIGDVSENGGTTGGDEVKGEEFVGFGEGIFGKPYSIAEGLEDVLAF